MTADPQRRHQPLEHQDLADALPAPGHPVLTQDRHRVLREQLMRHITDNANEPSTQGTSPLPPRRRRPSRRLVLTAAPLALAAALGLGLVAVDTGHHGGHDRNTVGVSAGAHRQATQLLDRIALAASTRPAATIRDDQYVYTKSEGSSRVWDGPKSPVRDAGGHITSLKTYQGNVQSQEWESVDGKHPGLRRLTGLTPSGTPDPAHTQNITMVTTPYLTFRQLQALPTDPDALLKALEHGNGVITSRLTETVFENVGTILDRASLLPDLDAALYRAIAELPDVHLVQNAKDAAGRTGIGLTYTTPTGHTGDTWVFDRTTLAYLGTTDSALLDVTVTNTEQAPTPTPTNTNA